MNHINVSIAVAASIDIRDVIHAVGRQRTDVRASIEAVFPVGNPSLFSVKSS